MESPTMTTASRALVRISPGENKHTTTMTTTTTHDLQPHPHVARASREQLRERERQSRHRRVEKANEMRIRVTELEQVALALRLVPDADCIWDEYVDEDIKSLRGSLRRLLSVVHERKRLAHQQLQLQELLAEHRFAALMVRHRLYQMTASSNNSDVNENGDDWENKTIEWKRLTRCHFTLWTIDQAEAMASSALQEMHQFTLSLDKQTTGLSFMGWRESRRVVTNSTILQFCFDNLLPRGYELAHHLSIAWRVFTEPELYRKVVLGGRGRVALDIVQQITPTAWIVRLAESHPEELPVTVHKMYLLVRVETEDGGAVQFFKGIQDHTLQQAINSASDLWTCSSCWVRYEHVETNADSQYRMYLGGTCDVGDLAFVPRWLSELLAVAIRSAAVGTGHWPLAFS